MTVITSGRNAEDLSMTMVAEFEAVPERLWDLWEGPRQLERWWGPSPYPATFTRYEFEPGGQCRYYMTGPENFMHYGWWRIDALDAPRWIEFVNGLAGDDGEPVPGLEPVWIAPSGPPAPHHRAASPRPAWDRGSTRRG